MLSIAQLSLVEIGPIPVRIVSQEFIEVLILIFPGQVMVGLITSLIVIVKLQLELLPEESVTV